jgi:hypothetical protein
MGEGGEVRGRQGRLRPKRGHSITAVRRMAELTGMARLDSIAMSARRPLSGKPDIAADMAVGPLFDPNRTSIPLMVR